jgi:hypothetical protein
MSRTKTKVLALTVASGLAVVGFFLTKPAFAGTNGQQLMVCKGDESHTQARLSGTNQDGVATSTTVSINSITEGCGFAEGFYWVGNVTVELSGAVLGEPNRTGNCDVPKELNVVTDTVICHP